MAVLDNKKNVSGGFGNSEELVRVVFDFDVDGGAIADYDVLEADGKCVVELAFMDVKTAVTSGGSLVLDLGKGAGGTDFLSNKAVAALTLDSIHKSDNPAAVELADGEKIVMGLEAAAATAGKLEMAFKVYKRV